MIILATGLDDRFMPTEQPGNDQNDEYFDKIISKLYREPMVGQRQKPMDKPKETEKTKDKPVEIEEPEESAQEETDEQQPSKIELPTDIDTQPHKPTFLERMKDWLAKNLGKLISDED